MEVFCYIENKNGETRRELLTIEQLKNSNYKVVKGHHDWSGTWTSLHEFEEDMIQVISGTPTIWLRGTNNVGVCDMKSYNT